MMAAIERESQQEDQDDGTGDRRQVGAGRARGRTTGRPLLLAGRRLRCILLDHRRSPAPPLRARSAARPFPRNGG